MPFLWKKVKNTTISQLVSDHLESQRWYRGHLVVETGFPASLVDLFVKNLDRLKKPKSSKKKKKRHDDFDNCSSVPSLTTHPSPLTTPPISRTPSLLSLASTQTLPSAFDNGGGRQKDVVNGVVVVDEEMNNERPNAKGVIGAIFRVFFVVVLALGAKKFAVGLTMSAFSLFLLEFVAKHSYILSLPCSEAKRKLRLKIQRILIVLRFRDKNLDDDDKSNCVTGIKGQLVASSEFNDHGHTSSISEFQPIFVEHIQIVRKEIGEFSCDRREIRFERGIGIPRKSHIERSRSDTELFLLEKNMEHGCDISDSKKAESKRARMKSKMKRLVPRRLRSSKKEKRVDVVLEGPYENEQQGNARNLKCDSNLSSLLSREHEENDGIDEICSSGLVNEENVEEIIIKKEQEEPRKGDSGYLILCLIVLIGLFGGRIIAFMLMVLWFLVLKSGERLRRCIKLPVIRSLSGKS